jgi:uncharacterized protein YtpQ (UPF0354 family)
LLHIVAGTIFWSFSLVVALTELLSSVLPQFFPAHWLEEAAELVFTDFPSQIRIGYVIRKQEGYSFLMRRSLEEACVSIDAVHAAAIANLAEMPLNGLTVGKTPGGSEAFLADVEDNFRAVRILLPRVHKVIAQELGYEYFVAIPCRDWFVAWSTTQEREWQQRNMQRAVSDYIDDEYNLTPDILLRSNNGFSLFLAQDC